MTLPDPGRRRLRGIARERLARLRDRVARSRSFQRWSYAIWIALYDRLTHRDRALIEERMRSLPERPSLSIVLRGCDLPEEWLRRSIDSVRSQIHRDWELWILFDLEADRAVPGWLIVEAETDARIRVLRGEGLDVALDHSKGSFIVVMEDGVELAEHALYLVAEEILAHPEAELVYGDEDRIGPGGERREPWFKSDWNPDLFLSRNFVGSLAFVRASTLRRFAERRTAVHGLLLHFAEPGRQERIRHVPHILCHVRSRQAASSGEAELASLREHFTRMGVAAGVEALPTRGWFRIHYPLPSEPPLVSVIVPNRDRAELLRACVESLLHRTRYPRLELLIVDNGSVEPETIEYLRSVESDERVRVLRDDTPFNFAALCNAAVKEARGPLLAFLNNDTEAIEPDWLEEMVSQALRPEIGAVGAKLLYPDGTLQHGGILLGVGGAAAHAHPRLPRDHPGYFGRAALVSNFSAVTAACMVLRREIFEEVDGFDAERFGVAFNDVDLCLRIGERGYRILWTPYASLYHHESASLGGPGARHRRERFARETSLLRERWGHVLEKDPAYNPNLTLRRGDFSLAFPPRARKPWRMAIDPEPSRGKPPTDS